MNKIPYHNWGLDTMKRANNSIYMDEYVKEFLFDTGWGHSMITEACQLSIFVYEPNAIKKEYRV
jgi:hypothetical protein